MANKNNPDAIPALIWVVSCKIKKLEKYIRSGRKNNGVNLLTEYNFNETPNNAKKHVLGLNLHWAPIDIRRKILKAFIKYNADNIKKNRPLELSKNLASKFWTLARPIFRKYIKSRISRRGAVIEPNEMGNIVSLRADHFINISAEQAWKIAVQKLRKK